MRITVTLKPPGIAFLNGIQVDDRAAAMVIRKGETRQFLPNGIVVELEPFRLDFDTLQRLWPVLNRLK